MNPTNLTSGVNRVTVTTTAPTQITDGVADDANIAGMFIYTRVPVRIWQMNNANAWSELDVLTGASGSRIVTVYFDATDVTRIFLQSMGADGALVRVVRREEAASVVQQDGVNNRVVGGSGVGPQGPAGPAGADGATGAQGPAGPSGGGLTANHIHTGSLTIDIPGDTATWSVIPSQFYGYDFMALDDDAKWDYTNPTNSGETPIVTNNMPPGTDISNITIGGFDWSSPEEDSPGYSPTYCSSDYYGWAPLQNRYKDFRHRTTLLNRSGFYNWHNESGIINQKSSPRYYTYGPFGGGPKGAKLEITGSMIMDPRSNIFIGDPSGDGLSEYPERWGQQSTDHGLLINRNMFVNNSDDTYFQFGDKRSWVNFASQSYVNFSNSKLHLQTDGKLNQTDSSAGMTFNIQYEQWEKGRLWTFIDDQGKVRLPPGTVLPSSTMLDKASVDTEVFRIESKTGNDDGFRAFKISIDNGTDYYPHLSGTLECHGRAYFRGTTVLHDKVVFSGGAQNDKAAVFRHNPALNGAGFLEDWINTARFGKHVDITRLHIGKGITYGPGYGQSQGSHHPTNANSPLMIRQPGQYFHHGVLLECPYPGEFTQGWGFRCDSTKELVFQAFQLDGNGDLIDGTYNNASFGRGYLSDGTDVGQITFTGQHRSLPSTGTVADFENKVGLIVVSTGKYGSMTPEDITVNDAMPKVELSSTANDKRAFGVVSNVEDVDSDERRFQLGAWGSSMTKPEGDDRVIINSVGEGGMWITDINGNLENGDYITTSDLEGYGMKQDGVQLCNYTVAKITMDCDFDLNSTEYRCEQIGPYKRAFVGVTYHCG